MPKLITVRLSILIVSVMFLCGSSYLTNGAAQEVCGEECKGYELCRIKCPAGYKANCDDAPHCRCVPGGPRPKQGEKSCGGECWVHTNWGKCEIKCTSGQFAHCIPGKSEVDIGGHQRITLAKCYCNSSPN
jgi:hypothetical protein